MTEYLPTIGLEIHAELKTATKMFCRSKNDAKEKRPNVNICPVCLAHPGTLPVINREAVRQVLRVGVVLGGALADYTEFDRKNYFYPDIPKGYQLSQYEFPLVSGGELKEVAITRVHLEEDTARSSHDDVSGETLVDFNRSGLPLMELVTEPVIKSAAQAAAFAKELQIVLRYLGASDADMEKGQMRVEANVSVSRDATLGTKVEVKNLNSFRSVERAIQYEIKRQSKLIEEGGLVVQETRGWDETKQETFAQRVKEGSADYRYFPDPDLPSLKISEIDEFKSVRLKEGIPEMPEAKRQRYQGMGIRSEDADQYVSNQRIGAFFDAVAKELDDDKDTLILASNYVANDLMNIIRDNESRDTEKQPEISLNPSNFASLIILIKEKKISSRAAKDILLEIFTSNDDPKVVAKSRGLFQTSVKVDIEAFVMQVLRENPSVVADYKGGKETALKFLIGQTMKVARGAGNPETIRDVLIEFISRQSP